MSKSSRKKTSQAAYDPHNVQHLTHALQQLTSDDDRTVAIISASMVENALECALRLRFNTSGNEDTVEALFDPEGVLGTFRSKIDLCLVLGVYGPVTRDNLIRIKDIRNRFAHRIVMPGAAQEPAPVSFRSQQIADWCRNLTQVNQLPLPDAATAKERFVAVSQAICLYLNEKQAIARWGSQWRPNPIFGSLDLP